LKLKQDKTYGLLTIKTLIMKSLPKDEEPNFEFTGITSEVILAFSQNYYHNIDNSKSQSKLN